MKNKIAKKINELDEITRDKVVTHHPLFSSKADKLTKWIPNVAVIALDSAGVKTKHNLNDKLKLLAAAEAVLNVFVYPLKHIVQRSRPNGISKSNSFPSGHTATSFLGAELLHQELKEHYPVASYSGYAVALTTGALRLYNNKHWLSDIVAGAVIGIMSAKVACRYFEKYGQKNKVSEAHS